MRKHGEISFWINHNVIKELSFLLAETEGHSKQTHNPFEMFKKCWQSKPERAFTRNTQIIEVKCEVGCFLGVGIVVIV